MAEVTNILEQTTFKNILAGRTCDFVDRLCYKFTVAILLVFTVIVSTKQFGGEPIHCWVPAQFKETWHTRYINQRCWVENSYFVPFQGAEMPKNVEDRMVTEIAYYQWIPVILLLGALVFVMPHLLYRVLCSFSGVNLSRVGELADKYVCAKKEDRESTIENLGFFIDKWICFKNRRRELGRFHHIMVRYLVVVYLLIKFLYLGLIIGVFFVLRAFLGLDSIDAGITEKLSGHEVTRESPRFPRITWCDVELRQLQNVMTYTIQCVLPINLFSEKIFEFLWCWFLFLGVLTFLNTLKWIYTFTWRNSNYIFVRKHLFLHKYQAPKKLDKDLCRRFAESYIGDDGCFLFRMMAINSTDLVVNDVLNYLWQKYQEDNKPTHNHT